MRRRILNTMIAMLLAASQQRPHPRQQFGEPERFAHIVVGAGVESHHEVDLVGARGQHEDGQRGSLGPDSTAHLEAVDLRESEVEDQ